MYKISEVIFVLGAVVLDLCSLYYLCFFQSREEIFCNRIVMLETPVTVVAMAAVYMTVVLNWLITLHKRPYSPDLAQSDYFLFPNIKKKNNWLGSSINVGPMMWS